MHNFLHSDFMAMLYLPQDQEERHQGSPYHTDSRGRERGHRTKNQYRLRKLGRMWDAGRLNINKGEQFSKRDSL